MDAAIASAARAKADLASTEAEVRQAQANVGTNESDLAKSVVRSPIDGIVLTRNIEPGQTVAATMTAGVVRGRRKAGEHETQGRRGRSGYRSAEAGAECVLHRGCLAQPLLSRHGSRRWNSAPPSPTMW